MENIFWLMAANGVVWLGVGAYLAFLARSQCAMERRLRQLEILKDA